MIHSKLLNHRIDIVKKYYRFTQKVLSFYSKSTIVLPKKYYRFLNKLISTLK